MEVGGFDNHPDNYDLTFRLLRNKFRIAYSPLSINYGEKPPCVNLIRRQRARWFKGFIDSLKNRLAEPKDMVGNLYRLAPLATFASLCILAIAGFGTIHNLFYGYFPYEYGYISFESWLLTNASVFLLAASSLVKQYGLSGLRYLAWLPLYVPFAVYYLATALRAFNVKSPASTKTDHGFGREAFVN